MISIVTAFGKEHCSRNQRIGVSLPDLGIRFLPEIINLVPCLRSISDVTVYLINSRDWSFPFDAIFQKADEFAVGKR